MILETKQEQDIFNYISKVGNDLDDEELVEKLMSTFKIARSTAIKMCNKKFNGKFGLKEDMSTTSDIAVQPAVIGSGETYKDMPVFCIDCADEFHSFSRGIKTFHLWKKHTKSEEIRQWARNNPGKSFVVKHNDSYMIVNRSKGGRRYEN